VVEFDFERGVKPNSRKKLRSDFQTIKILVKVKKVEAVLLP
jgi:hypothetical protein